ncbi:hypothetical protein GWI33_006907 [Rhynchophorus ferrugineus]|uniref:EB domain-containing protein n=1 Tax=Rhynchophorus ferrugineus TaxID=354439 RepID=A0A834ITI7_RHYFE|nr:hypothetical protein GWI33_006907 [Rhynchophorus ferrugineus]
MDRDWRRSPRWKCLLLLLLACDVVRCDQSDDEAKKKFGDKCTSTDECGFEGSVCDDLQGKCLCRPEVPVTNHLDKCGIAAKINESCTFNEQCETIYYLTECKESVCSCRYQLVPALKADGTVECIPVTPTISGQERYVDPAMIGILVAMFLMFITICIVLRLFSKARWRENRTIFNTPNPRLMNVSLLRESKLLHHERRGSKGSHGPSRPASMTSLQPHSPNSQGSRRGSKGSSVSGGSVKTSKSPPKLEKSPLAATPMLESSEAIEIQGSKA